MSVSDPKVQIQCSPSYFRKPPGILKCVQLIVVLLGYIFMLLSISRYHSYGGIFIAIGMLSFWFSGFTLVFHLFHVVQNFYQFPWPKIECFFCALLTILYAVASSLVVTLHSQAVANIFAGSFGFIAMVLYACEAWGWCRMPELFTYLS